jgi:biopolymer transport protein ExbD
MSENTEAKPMINVTPLIDVLLVLLIIFMVVSPMKPSAFKAKLPQEPKQEGGIPNITTLVVTVNPDSTLKINSETDFGTINEPQKLVAKLSETFEARLNNQVYADNMETRNDLAENERIEKTVFIKAPRKLAYGEVTKVVDAVKLAGASPISLQIDDLN